MKVNKDSNFGAAFYNLKKPTDMLDPGVLLKADGQPLDIEKLNQNERNAEGKRLATKMGELNPRI